MSPAPYVCILASPKRWRETAGKLYGFNTESKCFTLLAQPNKRRKVGKREQEQRRAQHYAEEGAGFPSREMPVRSMLRFSVVSRRIPGASRAAS